MRTSSELVASASRKAVSAISDSVGQLGSGRPRPSSADTTKGARTRGSRPFVVGRGHDGALDATGSLKGPEGPTHPSGHVDPGSGGGTDGERRTDHQEVEQPSRTVGGSGKSPEIDIVQDGGLGMLTKAVCSASQPSIVSAVEP